MKPVIIFGTGAPAVLAYHQLTMSSEYSVAGFTVDREYVQDTTFLELPVIAFDEITTSFSPQNYQALIALGYGQVNKLRAQKWIEVKNKGYSFVSYIHPTAVIYPGVKIGENCIIGEHTVVQHNTTIGDNVVIRDNCHIGHDSRIETHCFISSHANISGGVTIKSFCLLGAGCVVKEKVTVAHESVVGAGVTLLKDTNDKEVYMSKDVQKLPFPSDRIKI